MNEIILEKYQKKELTLTAHKAQIYALGFVLPILIALILPFYLFWKDSLRLTDLTHAIPNAATTAIIMIVGIVLHELLHGITWALFCKKGFKSIKFGITWKALTPYCHCSEILAISHYRLGGLMPAVVLGFLPSLTGIITGHLGLFFLGIFFTLAAGGDFLIFWMLRKENNKSFILDHPDKIGCYVYRSIPDKTIT